MLRKMLLVSPEYFERLRCRDDDDDVETEVNNERRNMRSLLKKKNGIHMIGGSSYEIWRTHYSHGHEKRDGPLHYRSTKQKL
jgi:hypothetical protein